MSVEKFKRILKLLISDFVRKSNHVAVHEVLNDVKNITATIEMVGDEKEAVEGICLQDIGEQEPEKLGEYYTKVEKSIYKKLKKYSKTDDKDQKDQLRTQAQNYTVDIKNYVIQKLKWKKAFEVLRDFLVSHKRDGREKNPLSDKEEEIYEFQIILNYLSKNGEEKKLKYLQDQLGLTSSYERTVKEILRKSLQTRPANDKSSEEKVRRSVFLKKELDILD